MQSHQLHQFALHAVELKRQGNIDASIRAYRLVFAVADEVNREKNYAGFGKSLFLAKRWKESMIAFQALMFQSASYPGGSDNYELSCLRAATCLLQVYREEGRLASLLSPGILSERLVDSLVKHMADSFQERDDQRAFDLLLATRFTVGGVFSNEMVSFVASEFGASSTESIPLAIVLRVLGQYSVDITRQSLLRLGRNVTCDDVESALGFSCLRQKSAQGLSAAHRMIEEWRD